MIVAIDDWELIDFIDAFYAGKVIAEAGESWMVGETYENGDGISQHFIRTDAKSPSEGFRITFQRADFQ